MHISMWHTIVTFKGHILCAACDNMDGYAFPSIINLPDPMLVLVYNGYILIYSHAICLASATYGLFCAFLHTGMCVQ